MKQPALLRVRPALMLGASAGSLRKALGSRATPRPGTSPGRAHWSEQASLLSALGTQPMLRRPMLPFASLLAVGYRELGYTRAEATEPNQGAMKKAISAWRGGEQILQPHPRPNQRTEALAPGGPGLNARTAAPIHVPPDDADDNDSRDDPHPRNVCGSGGRSLC